MEKHDGTGFAAPSERPAERTRKTSVVVIGGGIVGTSTALWLARDGVPVVLCEKAEIGQEQSSRNWGWCRTFGRDVRELDLSLLSLRLWRSLNDTIGGETGFRQSGMLTLAADDQHLAQIQALADALAGTGAGAGMVDAQTCATLAKGAVRRWRGGLYAPADGQAEPKLAAPAIAEGARKSGATILTGCAVLGIETQAGRICSVMTTKGRIDCDAVVICAGAWSTQLCRALGFRLPQLIVNESVSRTAPVSGAPDVALRTRDFALRKRLDGGYTIGGGGVIRAELTPDSFRFLPDFIPMLRVYGKMIRLHPTGHSASQWRALLGKSAPMTMLDPKPDEKLTLKVSGKLVRDFPVFANIAIEERWAGSIDVTPDAIPVVSPLPTEGAFVATGFSGHGFGMGPGAGALMAALVTGKEPPVNPSDFHVRRLQNVGKLKLGPL